MAITIGDHKFEGPFPSTDDLKNQSGVYVILDKWSDGTNHILDVGESETVKERVDTHDRKDCWKENQQGTLTVAALYTGEASRMKIEREIRQKYNVPCGER